MKNDATSFRTPFLTGLAFIVAHAILTNWGNFKDGLSGAPYGTSQANR